jgi:hypothetical protein
MLYDEASGLVQLGLFEPPILSRRNRVEPEFGNSPIAPDVNVRGLALVRAEKDEAVGRVVKYSRHRPMRFFAL